MEACSECCCCLQVQFLYPFVGSGSGQIRTGQLPSAPLQPGSNLGEPAESAAFQPEGLTDPHNSLGAGALINQLSEAGQAAASPTVLPQRPQEDIKASLRCLLMFVCCGSGHCTFDRQRVPWFPLNLWCAVVTTVQLSVKTEPKDRAAAMHAGSLLMTLHPQPH